jgi:cell division septum initiation protein DivIVA
MPDFTVVIRGYDRTQVDKAISRLLSSPPGSFVVPKFDIVMRGYERTQVDAYMRRWAGLAVTNGSAPALAPPSFSVVMQGYERAQVDKFVHQAIARIAELERALAEANAR